MTQDSQDRHESDIVRKIRAVIARHDGFRTLHADGRVTNLVIPILQIGRDVDGMSAALRDGGWRRAARLSAAAIVPASPPPFQEPLQ